MLVRCFLSSLVLLFCSGAQAFEPLYSDDAKALFTQSPRLVVLWSLDCPPCFKELDMLTKALKQNPNLPITLIATNDDTSRYPQVKAVYESIHGKQLKKWVFAESQARQLMFLIDKSWQGELPRSYLVDGIGNRKVHSGLLTKEGLDGWFSLEI